MVPELKGQGGNYDTWKYGRVVYACSLENCRTRERSVSSNLTASARIQVKTVTKP